MSVFQERLNLGLCFHNKGDYTNGMNLLQKSLNLRIKIYGEEHRSVAASYNNIGTAFSDDGKYGEAIEYFQKALAIQLKVLGKEHPEIANSYDNLGDRFSDIGEYDQALAYHQKALDMQIKLLGPDHQDVAGSYNSIGNCASEKGEYDLAIDYYKKALNIWQKTLGPLHPYVAYPYNSIGNRLSDKGKYDQAIEFHQKALNIRLKAMGENHPIVAQSLNNIASGYSKKGEYDRSIDFHQKALDIQLKTLDKNHPNIATSYNNIGNRYSDKGEIEKAIEYFQKAIEIQLANSNKEHPDIARSYNNLGITLRIKGDFDQAYSFHQKALSIRLKIFGDKHQSVAMSHLNIGNVLLSSGKFEEAITSYSNALSSINYHRDSISHVSDLPMLITILTAKGNSEYEKYLSSKNQVYLFQSRQTNEDNITALNFLSKTQSSINQYQTANVYAGGINSGYQIYQLTNSKSYIQEALILSESSKSFLLRQALQEAEATQYAEIDSMLLHQEYQYRLDLTWREKQRQSLLDKGLSETDTTVLRISSIIFDLRQEYETLKQRLEDDYPHYYRLKYDLSTVSLDYVQDSLLDGNQALLEYFVGDSSLFLFVVRPDTLIVQEVKRDFLLEDWIEQFRQGLYGYHSDKNKPDALFEQTLTQYLGYAPKLYEKLIQPVEKWLPKNGKVIIVPDGPLGYVPFDALLTGAPADPLNFKTYPYLLNKYQFSYTYSATLLREMRDKQHRKKPADDLVAFAPFYDGNSKLLETMFTHDELMRKDLNPLPFSGKEVAAASKLMKGRIVSGSQATKARFIQDAGNYRILHLATHGRADNRVGDYAFLLFSEIKDSIDNELLYVKDLYNLSLNADLVVLSACETGIGKLQRGEGIISLARAFAYAGAKSMVSSLWSVNDASTYQLMRYFYRDLKKGRAKDEALRNARLDYLKREKTSERCHPFFWAAFVPVGDMRAVDLK